EETRVVVVRGNRVEEFDFETAQRKQLRGNIYLAKVTRVEPSLQAAFVDYGGNRHGFLAFSEIHPDYYQIPIADRQALIDEEERAHRDAEAEADRRAGMRRPRHRRAAHAAVDAEVVASAPIEAEPEAPEPAGPDEAEPGAPGPDATQEAEHHAGGAENETHDAAAGYHEPQEAGDAGEPVEATAHEGSEQESADAGEPVTPEPASGEPAAARSDIGARPEGGPGDDHHDALDHQVADHHDSDEEAPVTHEATSEEAGTDNGDADEEEEIVESVGGADAMEEVPDRTPRPRRQYKIQEVIKRRQVMLVQVVKEERGTKGAALTTYLSLAGRYSVLMPNTARGGGISRKITNVQDRKRLKEIASELEVPEGMGVILRTAGAARTKLEIKRDFEYLLRAWENVRDLTLRSTAPTLVYEEGSLVKRSIRDLYNKDIDEVIVAGDAAYRDARDFMRMLMPSHARHVKPYRENQPMLARYGIESQLDGMFSPVVQLRSGGYIVLNQTEALVAIDVNSGRATREHHIEDTALKTNLEASEEISRQLRLRDLAGLIVIDFIDMDEKRNNRSVERRLKECLKNDRARIQVGRISHFGLLEMSRQRIRTSVLESSTDKCPHCGGTGHVRSVSSVALQCLRMIEESLQRGATHNLNVRTRPDIALYVLNHKRAHLYELEKRYQITISVTSDPNIAGQQPFVVEKGEQVHSPEQARSLAAQWASTVATLVEHTEEEPVEELEEFEAEAAESDDEGGPSDEDAVAPHEAAEVAESAERGENGDGRRRRRRRRRGGRRDERAEGPAAGAAEEAFATPSGGSDEDESADADEEESAGEEAARDEAADERGGRGAQAAGDGDRRRRRRGRRGGRRNRREEGEGRFTPPEHGASAIEEEVMAAAADFGGPPIEQIPHAVSEYAPSGTEPEPAHEMPEAGVSESGLPATRSSEAHTPERRSRTPSTDPDPAPAAATGSSSTPSVAEPPASPPRRRSTVREPAPFLVGGGSAPAADTKAPAAAEPAPPAQPAPAPSSPAEPGAPRRAGWWGKRLFGEKT
ncbi:MAG: Rne/Rng family ribonuclease, partial [Xanthobacteraceae bacterium]|nr:Rne/Rng family ribonuclease [Xanthobacteraceae bacterium]